MELKICGSEIELAAFIKALGSTIMVEGGMPKIEAKVEKVEPVKVEKPKPMTKAKPKAIASTPKTMLNSAELAKKCGITAQSIASYARKGMPHILDKQKYLFDEETAMAWIQKYQTKHPSKSRGAKYNKSANTNTEIKLTVDESGYTKWKRKISMICRESGMNEGKLLSLAYKRMTKNYGIVWEQIAKDFYRANERKAVSTLELAYSLEQSGSVYKNLLEANIDAVIKETKTTN